MAHDIQIIVAKETIINQITIEWFQASSLSLPQGFAMIPITMKFYDDINELANNQKPKPYKEFDMLSSSVEEFIRVKSHQRIIAYIETDYFGGAGAQSAILFENQQVKIGPLRTKTNWDAESQSYKDTPEGYGAINEVLKELGVYKLKDKDEFDSINLGHYRSNEEIVEEAKNLK